MLSGAVRIPTFCSHLGVCNANPTDPRENMPLLRAKQEEHGKRQAVLEPPQRCMLPRLSAHSGCRGCRAISALLTRRWKQVRKLRENKDINYIENETVGIRRATAAAAAAAVLGNRCNSFLCGCWYSLLYHFSPTFLSIPNIIVVYRKK